MDGMRETLADYGRTVTEATHMAHKLASPFNASQYKRKGNEKYKC